MNKFIPTNLHGIIDYMTGALLIAMPWAFGFASDGAETVIPVVMGMGIIAYSLFTDYELSAVKAITMKMHLRLDFLGGLFLVVAPWLFGFADRSIATPFVVIGIFEILITMMTQTQPRTSHILHHHNR